MEHLRHGETPDPLRPDDQHAAVREGEAVHSQLRHVDAAHLTADFTENQNRGTEIGIGPEGSSFAPLYTLRKCKTDPN